MQGWKERGSAACQGLTHFSTIYEGFQQLRWGGAVASIHLVAAVRKTVPTRRSAVEANDGTLLVKNNERQLQRDKSPVNLGFGCKALEEASERETEVVAED